MDIPPDWDGVGAGAFSGTITARGKAGATGRPAEGVNDYTGWFAGDSEMAGTYKGYDGPCPPWNDSIVHRYVFSIHALDVESLQLADDFTLDQVRAAMDGHVLDQATLTGTYTLNPRLAAS